MSLAIRILAAVVFATQLSGVLAQQSAAKPPAAPDYGVNGIFPGENLLNPYLPPSPEWQARSNKENGIYRMIWLRGNEIYGVTVIRDSRGSLTELREINDQPGRANCESFDSSVRSKTVTPYPSITWLTDCKRGGRTAVQMLHRAIRGADSHYLIQKTWRGPVGADELQLWEGRIKSASVCDTRKAPGCPAGLRELK
jgi:hypothetical protein